MSPTELSYFTEINREAAKIADQNARYERLANCGHPDSTRNAQNRVASEQAGHIALLGELSAELPYEQIGQRDVEIDQGLNASRESLERVETTSCVEKLAVLALSSKIINECYPQREAEVEAGVAERFKEIDRARRLALENRINDLGQERDDLDQVIEVAGQAWPVPIAHYQEAPIIELRPPATPQPEYVLYDGELVETIEGPMVVPSEPLTEAERLNKFRERHIDEPNASPLVAFYLIDNEGSSVGADELVNFLYSHVEEEGRRERHELQSRVTTMLGPKIQGQRMKRLLAEEGYALQYGWHQYVTGQNGSTKMVTKRRAYKALPLNDEGPDLPAFTEVIRIDQLAA